MDNSVATVVDRGGPDGAALLGLGYGSDADSQDSGDSQQIPKAKIVKDKAEADEQGSRASPAGSLGHRDAVNGDKAAAPAAGRKVKKEEEEEEQKAVQARPSFVKGQR